MKSDDTNGSSAIRRFRGNRYLWLNTLSILLFYALAIRHLDLPGLGDDEAREAGAPAMQMLLSQPIDVLDHGVWLGLPLVVQRYNGALPAYYSALWMAIGSIDVFALRYGFVMSGVITLPLMYVIGKRLFTPRIGITSVFLVATLPIFVYWSRQGAITGSLSLPFMLGSVAAALRWCRSEQRRFALLSGFLVGAALHVRAHNVWFLAVAVPLAVYKRRLPRYSGYSFAGLSLPLLPFVLYNIQSNWETIRYVIRNATTTNYSVNNLQIFSNLAVRLRQVYEVMSGSLQHGYFDYGATHTNHISGIAFIVALVASMWFGWLRHERILRGLLLLNIGMLVLATFTTSGLWANHLIFHLPWLCLIFAHIINLPPRKWGTAAVLLIVLSNIVTTWQYQRTLLGTGGVGHSNAAIYELAARLDDDYHDIPVFALDWGIGPAVTFLTEGRVTPEEEMELVVDDPESLDPVLADTLHEAPVIILTHTEKAEVFRVRKRLIDLLANTGQTAEVITIATKLGEPFYEIWIISPD